MMKYLFNNYMHNGVLQHAILKLGSVIYGQYRDFVYFSFTCENIELLSLDMVRQYTNS
jgi:hypothetical protein